MAVWGLGISSPVQPRGWLIAKALSVRLGLSAGNPVFMSKVRLLKGFSRAPTKPKPMLTGFIHFTLIMESIVYVNDSV